MSVIGFSKDEISQIMSSVFSNHRDFVFTYHERCMFNEHSRNDTHIKLGATFDTLQMDDLRFFFERVYLSNQLQYQRRYNKYGSVLKIEYNPIEYLQLIPLPNTKLLAKLKSIRYNSDEFLNPQDSERLDRIINAVTERVLQLSEVTA